MPKATERPEITDVIGKLQYRLALAGGWIDQPFVSRLNPDPPGAMVVVAVEPQFRWMDRSGICGSTRQIALELWGGTLPNRDPEQLVRELYRAENEGRAEPSGSQDMIGLIYPGISRLDYDFRCHDGLFPAHIESCNDPAVAAWLAHVLHILPVAPRPDGYNPLETKNLDPAWIARLGRSGRNCYDAIIARDIERLGASMNECMKCWEAILPGTVHHRTLRVDLIELLRFYQSCYPGAMYSGCGGGYLFVASEQPVPGAFTIQVRIGTP
ncbi:MAG TPA: hypothetical protein PLU87_10650 [Sedimentisphaerales bacterium]|nr:hypothetical protein [Sedimentisphaerales bacterium]HRS11675.1 hypothetical protein [Sedimentisphaerales bacterium]HRV48338.1 hypothetical protein [Sedimentisphaerales bacterium]